MTILSQEDLDKLNAEPMCSCSKGAEFNVEVFNEQILSIEEKALCNGCLPSFIQENQNKILAISRINCIGKKMEFLEKIFTPEEALKHLGKEYAPQFEGESVKCYWSPDMETEEITFIKKEACTDNTFQLYILRIHIDALIDSLSWNDLDAECVEEFYLTLPEIDNLNNYLGESN